MATSLRPPRFPDENTTLRSFPLFHPPTRPSMDSVSMKSRKSFLNLIVPARRLASGNPTPASGSKLKQASNLAENLAIPPHSRDVKATAIGSRDAQNKPPVNQNSAAESASKDPLQRARSKSRTILRVISTTFRSRSPLSPTSPPLASTSLQAKQNREDALRERGLLPPKPSKDLSRQEADLDRQLPILPLDRPSVDESVEPSAADLIRQEWEAKNKPEDSADSAESRERERMKTFRFGTPSPSPSPISLNFPRSAQLETVAEANSPLPSPLLDGPLVPLEDPAKGAAPKVASLRSSASAEPNLFEPTCVPLPPSPLPTPPPTPSRLTSRKSNSISSATNPPLTSSHPVLHGDIESSSSHSGHNRSGSRRSSSSALPPTNPVISLTPPEHMNSLNKSPSAPSLIISAPHRRSESLTQMPSISESAASMMTPSLDTSPGSPTTISTLHTADSFSSVPGPNASGGPKGKHSLLKVKAPEQVHPIPMIVESPVEDASAEPEAIPEITALPLSPVSESNSPMLEVPPQPSNLTRRGRGLTDPGQREKRKLFNPFKRGQSAGSESNGISRKISVASSFGNLRRVASNFTKPRSSFDAGSMAPSTLSGKAKTFDASHLPPSPTLPRHFIASNSGLGSTGLGLKPPNRRPLDPTLHNRASILTEMNAIKDDEVRRMTEVAFLG